MQLVVYKSTVFPFNYQSTNSKRQSQPDKKHVLSLFEDKKLVHAGFGDMPIILPV